MAKIKIANNPGTKSIDYGDVLVLYAEGTIPEGTNVKWYVNGEQKGTGKEFRITGDKNVTVTVKIIGDGGNALKDADGNEILLAVDDVVYERVMTIVGHLIEEEARIREEVDNQQWEAINSGITSELVTKLGNLPTAAALAEALASKQNVLTFDSVPTEGSNNPVKSGGVYSAIDEEKGARLNSDAALQQSIEAILLLIPTAASSLNQLADKAFVNSSISTATATFRGTFNLVNDLHLTLAATHAQIGNALALTILNSDNNDYAFVQIPTVETAPT